MERGSVLLVGPDGSGKTTVLDALIEALGDTPVTRAHSRPGLIAGRGDGTGVPVTDPHGQHPRGTVASLAKLAVVFLDTLLGTWVRWRPAARDAVLVIERGWYDLAVDPRRYRLPHRLAPLVRRLGRLLPRHELAVVLVGDPAAFHARKPEIGVDEVARQLAAWQRLAPRAAKRVLEIDTVSTTPREAASLVRDAVARQPTWRRVPLAPARLSFRATGPSPALSIYRPFKPMARLAAAVHPALLRTPLATKTDLPPLAHRVVPDGHEAAAMRSSAPGRWIVATSQNGRIARVVKIGAASDEGLRNEAAVLETLQPPSGYVIPDCTDTRDDGDHLAVILSPISTTGRTPSLDDITDLCTTLVRGDWGIPMVHGDLAPWNVAVAPGGITICDWEDATLGVEWPLHDLTHYVVRAGVLLGQYDPAGAARLLADPDGPGARHLGNLAIPTPPCDHVKRYLARTVPTSRKERVYRDALRTFLPDS